MSIYQPQASFEPPLTDQERNQHWGTPSQAEGPIVRPLVDESGNPLLPALAKSLKTEMTAVEPIVPSTLADDLEYAFHYAYEYRGHQLRAQMLWDFTASFLGKATGWIKEVAARFVRHSGKVADNLGEGKWPNYANENVLKVPSDYWARRAQFYVTGL